jgi:hypothetical protein
MPNNKFQHPKQLFENGDLNAGLSSIQYCIPKTTGRYDATTAPRNNEE